MDKLSKFSKSFREYKKHPVPALAELLLSEEIYIEQMELIINCYMAEYQDENSQIPVPESLKGVKGLLFTNINDIYEWHKNYFLPALTKRQNSLTEVGKVFTQNEHQFHMYTKFCNNTRIVTYLVSKNAIYFDTLKNKFGHKLHFNDLIAAPFQRLMRYPLLLKEIIGHIKKENLIEHLESLNAALSMIQTVCKGVNDFNAIQGIHNFDRQISDQGKLLLQDYLTCKFDGKKRKLYVFLFQQLIIFTKREEAASKHACPTYTFVFQIPMNKLQLIDLQNNQFLVKSTGFYSADIKIECKADTIEKYQQWLSAITKQLSTQQQLIFDLVHPSPNDDEDDILV